MNKLSKLYNRDDAKKWAHPELEVTYESLTGTDMNFSLDVSYNHAIPLEDRRKQVAAMDALLASQYEQASPELAERRSLCTVNGCPEEPDTEVTLEIYRPLKPSKRKLPVLLIAAGGGMYCCMSGLESAWKKADKYNCVVVIPRYRTGLFEKYPASLNDLHAGYQYVVDHAEELNINPDKIVLYGNSSGTNLALSLAHRLKRYGYSPRGCVVVNAFADYRPIFGTSTITSEKIWDGRCQYYAGLQYLGYDNVPTTNTPEMYPNFATAEECIGICPTFMHTDAEEASSDSCKAYASTLSKAGVYNELHNWGGSAHGVAFHTALEDPDSEYGKRFMGIVDGNIMDCMKYDLRRQWISDFLKED